MNDDPKDRPQYKPSPKNLASMLRSSSAWYDIGIVDLETEAKIRGIDYAAWDATLSSAVINASGGGGVPGAVSQTPSPSNGYTSAAPTSISGRIPVQGKLATGGSVTIVPLPEELARAEAAEARVAALEARIDVIERWIAAER